MMKISRYKADSQDDKPFLPLKLKMYRSKFQKSIKEKEKEMKTAKHLQHKTFGFAELPLPKPNNFLKKDEGIRQHYDRPQTSHHRCNFRRPPIPHLDELKKGQSMQDLKTEKNFKFINIKRAKSAVLRNKPGPKCFEQMAPVYIHSPKYGKVPRYLENINEQFRKMEIESKKQHEEGRNEKGIRALTQEEKNQLLDGLRHNWDIMQKEYQKMPLLIDTVPKQIRKTRLENNLKSLERDICLLNTPSKCIFIVPD
ncbi:CLUMA_CG016765, isoform A [Clunio marinus]|uniref:CLUMA_CG016765, isoform A n=1 Tax=Clunio marinus TaxID=568069 RepID=A0A1J1IWA4_9DIPT|nr:CLUMA_CG016765, isoform A [Clunio marinus]